MALRSVHVEWQQALTLAILLYSTGLYFETSAVYVYNSPLHSPRPGKHMAVCTAGVIYELLVPGLHQLWRVYVVQKIVASVCNWLYEEGRLYVSCMSILSLV
jgi:hypothetical protein